MAAPINVAAKRICFGGEHWKELAEMNLGILFLESYNEYWQFLE